MLTRNFNLFLNAGYSTALVINVNQYDRGEQWVFTLYNEDGTQYVPSSGAIVGIKSDGLGIINTASVVDGKVVVNETQQMTAAAGRAEFELLIDAQTHGTANFVVMVEPKPADNADMSESDLSLLQQAIDSTSQAIVNQSISDWMDDNLTPTTPVVDASLTVSGAAADAKKTGDEISDLKSAISKSTGNSPIQMGEEHYYINTNSSPVSLTPQYSATYPWRSAVIECSGGDKFIINANGGQTPRAWAFLDSSNNILSNGAYNATYTNYLITAPENTTKLIINDRGGNTSYKGEFLTDRVSTIEADLKTSNELIYKNTPFTYELTFSSGKFIISSTGVVGTDANMACTEEYYRVYKGQKLLLHLSAYGSNECAVAFYNSAKVFQAYATSEGDAIATVESDGFARFSTKTTQITVADAYVRNVVSDSDDSGEQAQGVEKQYFISDSEAFVTSETTKTYTAETPKLDYSYKGSVTPHKRFLAIGFDDFRNSDFSAIMPLFEKYDARATFNKVIRSDGFDENKINSVIYGGHEVGDHTFMHYAFPYEDALFNGQNPSSLDGSQTPYPTNSQLRDDTGNGRNAFYLLLTAKVNATVANSPLDSSATWGNLTDAQCQTLREYYSVFNNPTLSTLLDSLSNEYLGTSGSSAGSWNSNTGKYTGGIFTGCATSANHEVWERILTIMQMYYKDKYGLNWSLQCWSWPGEYYFGRGFSSNGYLKYYDESMTLYYNMNAKFKSSLYTDELGGAKSRSFTDVLREFGYKYTHDYIYPSRLDYTSAPAMKAQFYINESLSKEDGVLYPTNRTVTYTDVANSYPSTFFTTAKSRGSQMYDVDGAFRNFIEALRHDTAHGLVHGEVIDSVDNYSMRVFFEEALRYCKSAGIEVITKAEAYDICFNHMVENGNLIYNPQLKNTVRDFFTDATNLPTTPDGYSGSCSVSEDANGNILVTTGDTIYIHYGIPLGKIKYSADVKGSGTINIYLIKCGSAEALSNLDSLASISVNESDFVEKSTSAVVPDNPITTWTPKLEGRDNKVMGLKVVYSSGLQIKNIKLVKE